MIKISLNNQHKNLVNNSKRKFFLAILDVVDEIEFEHALINRKISNALCPTAIFTGVAPLALANADVPTWVWIATGVVGAVLIMLNRRPSN